MLRAFRADAYACFRYRADALFEIMDALLTTGPTLSPAHLSLAPAHRRGWGSLYAALTHGRMTRGALRDLVARYPLADGEPIYAVDVSVWARCDAETSPERGYYYHPSRHSAGQPIVAAAQIKEVVRRLPAAGPVPLCVCDAGYDPVQLALDLGATPVATLVRLRKDRCCYADPDPATAATGRPRRHGRKFACKDPATWPTPTAAYATDDDCYGRVRVRAWANLHPIPQNHATKGTRGPKPIVRGTLVLVEVERLPRQTRTPKQLWLWWQGPEGSTADVALLWRAYVRRFDQEHTFRFYKQILT